MSIYIHEERTSQRWRREKIEEKEKKKKERSVAKSNVSTVGTGSIKIRGTRGSFSCNGLASKVSSSTSILSETGQDAEQIAQLAATTFETEWNERILHRYEDCCVR